MNNRRDEIKDTLLKAIIDASTTEEQFQSIIAFKEFVQALEIEHSIEVTS